MHSKVIAYYRNRNVLLRLLEYLGVSPEVAAELADPAREPLARSSELKQIVCQASTEYIAVYGQDILKSTGRTHASFKPFALGWALDQGLDLHRSVWDRQGAVFVLDVEYFSKNFPGEPFLNPERVFNLLEPVYRIILEIFISCGIHPMAVVTGQGYNFVFMVHKNSPGFAGLTSLGIVEPALAEDYLFPSPRRGRPVPEKDALAFDAQGKLMEFIYHQLFLRLRNFDYPLPVTAGDIVPGNERREGVSLDLSLYSHPLHKRSIRCPFSVYSKHFLKGHIVGEHVFRQTGPLFCQLRRIWTMETPLSTVLKIRKSAEKSAEQAGAARIVWNDQTKGVERLISSYKSSAMHNFHREFDSVPQDDSSQWPQGYHRFDTAGIPPCAGLPLIDPNPLLLQPTCLQTVVRVLMAAGWHPKHIAGLIYSKYAGDYKWEVNFRHYDPNRWANVWVRNFAGMVHSGADPLEDMTCRAQQQKGEAWKGRCYCPDPGCSFDLEKYRSILLRKCVSGEAKAFARVRN